MPNGDGETLREALRKSYLARAKVFVKELRGKGIKELFDCLDAIRAEELPWDLFTFGITEAAFEKVKQAGVQPHLVFCHPNILQKAPKAIEYYRNLAALSRKGLGQLLAGLPKIKREQERLRQINTILSALVEDTAVFDLPLARSVIPAELGTEIQGTWVNLVGRGAASYVNSLITDYAKSRDCISSTERVKVKATGKKKTREVVTLTNNWTIVFADEPDVSIRNPQGVLMVAIEVKGSTDKAGAQTRYGEAKKSFAKALKEHGQCETIYLASCITDAVNSQIKTDAQVRKVFNLIEIMADKNKESEFLKELFVHQIRILN